MNTCPHADAQLVQDFQNIWVEDLYSSVDIYFCSDCMTDFPCTSGTFQIVSPLSMQDLPADDASKAGDEVYDGRF